MDMSPITRLVLCIIQEFWSINSILWRFGGVSLASLAQLPLGGPFSAVLFHSSTVALQPAVHTSTGHGRVFFLFLFFHASIWYDSIW